MRLFIAIPVDEPIKKELSGLKFSDRNLRWIPPENMHITLKFVGDLHSGQAENLAEDLGQISFSSFKLKVQGTGAFPAPDNPAVLWAGIQAPGKLTVLQQQVAAVAEKHGAISDQRIFNPHITLARVKKKGVPGKELQTFLKVDNRESFGTIRADQFNLYQSILQKDGANYVAVRKYRAADR